MKRYSDSGIVRISIPIPFSLSKRNIKMPFAIRNKLLIMFIILFRRNILKTIEKEFNPDIIISHLQISGLVSKVIFTTRKNQFLRLYGTQRTYDFIKEHWYRYTNWENILPFILKMRGYILVDDGTNSNALAKMFRVKDSKILFIRNGADVYKENNEFVRNSIRIELGIPDDAVVGIHVNRLHYFKSIDSLVQFINSTSDDIHWIIIGNGPDADKLKSINKQQSVHWLKEVDNKQLANYYSTADFLVNFNILSTLNNPNYEALRMHLPVFGLRRGYNCEDINEIMVVENSVEKLIELFNNEYYPMIKEKGDNYKNLIRQITYWEKEYLYTWKERYQMEWKFIINRIDDVEEDC